MTYTKTVEGDGPVKKVVYTSPLGDVVEKDKGEIRNALVAEGLNPEDILADMSNALSLVITLQTRLYGALTEEQKANIPSNDRQLIEYVFTKFKSTNTSADLKFSAEGTGMIDKIFTRWSRIGTIVNSIKRYVTGDTAPAAEGSAS